jgi:hypothetical protein
MIHQRNSKAPRGPCCALISTSATMFLELSLHPILPLCGVTVSCLSYYASVVANVTLLAGAIRRDYIAEGESFLHNCCDYPDDTLRLKFNMRCRQVSSTVLVAHE